MSQLKAGGPSHDRDNPSKKEAERFYRKATDEFDRWFYSHTKERQDEMRRDGVLPYAEMKADEYVFPVNTFSETTVITPIYDPNEKAGQETFYSREKVEEFTRRLLMTLEYSHSAEVRLHFQLIRLVLRDSRAMTNDQLAKLYGMTRAGINFRVQRIRQLICGAKRPSKSEKNEEKHGKCILDTQRTQKTPKNRGKMPSNPGKESPRPPTGSRVAPHRGQKARVSSRNPRGAKK
jgi:hypothetical protein